MMVFPASAAPDRPLRVIQTVPFDFGRPSVDLSVPASGEVRMLVMVDQTGQLHDQLVLGAAHPSFVAPVAAGLAQWQFVPPEKAGQPIGVRATLRIYVEPNRGVAAVSIMEAVTDKLRGRREIGFENYVATAGELDQPLQAIQRSAPVVPAEWSAEPREPARVVVDFYIDQAGRPRMPVIEASPDPLLSAAVIDALAGWQFELPVRHRRPVIVRVRQEFTFPAQGVDIENPATPAVGQATPIP